MIFVINSGLRRKNMIAEHNVDFLWECESDVNAFIMEMIECW